MTTKVMANEGYGSMIVNFVHLRQNCMAHRPLPTLQCSKQMLDKLYI